MDMEAAENRSLPSVLAPRLHVALLQLSRRDATKQFAQQALKGLAGFVKALKVTYQDIEVGLDLEPERGLADSGNLEGDLQALFEVAGEAAKKGSTSLVLLIDELQYVPKDQLAALIAALHRTAQRRLPVIMVGAGLPQLRGQMGNAKSYAERLFDFPLIGSLSTEDARIAIAKPAAAEGVSIDPDALDEIMVRTQDYPYFLQEWGKHVWDVAETSPITTSDVVAAIHQAKAALDANFFLVRLDRLTPSERRYLRAMAHLGAGPHRSGAIAQVLNRQVQSLAPVRSQLIGKGMLWSPGHGDTDFTVPMFDEFMQRIMPGDQWRSTA
ncbi:MAG: ATP-binding protein [Caldilineaceae bacterium]|nr:ATP-binding protein [Caldilineaceae bacterium]